MARLQDTSGQIGCQLKCHALLEERQIHLKGQQRPHWIAHGDDVTTDNGTLQVLDEKKNIRHEIEALVWHNRMLDPWLVIGHPKGPHCSVGAPHDCGGAQHMKPYRRHRFNNADYDGLVNCAISGMQP